jgi:hypothetical protein
MVAPIDDLNPGTGREIYDVRGEKIGTVVGFGYARKKFGMTWLRVEIRDGHAVLVPAERLSCSGDRLVSPYLRSYVEATPVFATDEQPSRDEERRLRLHYGIDSGNPNATCRVGCGLCWVRSRDERRRDTG